MAAKVQERDYLLLDDVLLRNIDLKGKSYLDVGCGLGDLVPYLNERTSGDFEYIGIDISDELLKDAISVHKKENIKFILGDIFDLNLPNVDIALNSGALSFKLPGMKSYAKATIERMYDLSSEVISLNFLSKYVDFELEKNQHYYPESIYKWAKALSSNINLLYDYPLHEFTIQIFKNNKSRL